MSDQPHDDRADMHASASGTPGAGGHRPSVIALALAVAAGSAVAGCSSAPRAADPVRARAHASPSGPYRVEFVNDTRATVVVVGCPACGNGRRLPPSARWLTGVGGGRTDVLFDRPGGARIGCVHLMNGVLPAPEGPAQLVLVSRGMPCRG
jgi:hypothetical protein